MVLGEIFSENTSLDDSGSSLAASLLRTNLKLHNITVISVMVKEVITALYSSKAFAFDWTLVGILRN